MSELVVQKLVGVIPHECGPDCAFPDLPHMTPRVLPGARVSVSARDLRFGKPKGFVVQGTTVETLPVRPRWEATTVWNSARTLSHCAYCVHFAQIGRQPGAHRFRNEWHP